MERGGLRARAARAGCGSGPRGTTENATPFCTTHKHGNGRAHAPRTPRAVRGGLTKGPPRVLGLVPLSLGSDGGSNRGEPTRRPASPLGPGGVCGRRRRRLAGAHSLRGGPPRGGQVGGGPGRAGARGRAAAGTVTATAAACPRGWGWRPAGRPGRRPPTRLGGGLDGVLLLLFDLCRHRRRRRRLLGSRHGGRRGGRGSGSRSSGGCRLPSTPRRLPGRGHGSQLPPRPFLCRLEAGRHDGGDAGLEGGYRGGPCRRGRREDAPQRARVEWWVGWRGRGRVGRGGRGGGGRARWRRLLHERHRHRLGPVPASGHQGGRPPPDGGRPAVGGGGAALPITLLPRGRGQRRGRQAQPRRGDGVEEGVRVGDAGGGGGVGRRGVGGGRAGRSGVWERGEERGGGRA